jgi:hypothetical protein
VVPHPSGGATSSDTAAPCEGRHGRETRTPVRGAGRRRGAHAQALAGGARDDPAARRRGPLGCTSLVTGRAGCPRRTRHWHRQNDVNHGTRLLALECDCSPNSVAPDRTLGSPLLRFLPHSPGHLCYDGIASTHGGQVPGRPSENEAAPSGNGALWSSTTRASCTGVACVPAFNIAVPQLA